MHISLTCIIVHFIDFFSYERMNERERKKERKRERERETETERKVKKLKEKTQEAVCLETSIKFSIDSLYPKFLHLNMHLSSRVT